jgi:hypothetical protein
MHAKADFEVTAGGSCASSYKKTAPSRGMVSAPSCELKTCTPATCSAWASGHFSAQTVVAILLIIVGVTPTDKFAADATQLPTGCQPESLAKPARRRSHKPNAPIAVPEKKPHSGRGRGFFSISDMAECSFAKFHLNQKSHGPRGRERLNGETNSLKRRKTARPSWPTLCDSFIRSNGRGFRHTQRHPASAADVLSENSIQGLDPHRRRKDRMIAVDACTPALVSPRNHMLSYRCCYAVGSVTDGGSNVLGNRLQIFR